MIRIFRHMRVANRWMALLVLFCVAGQVYFDLELPNYTGEVTELIAGGVTELSQYFETGLRMMGCVLCSAILTVVVGFLAARIAADFSYDIRGKLFNKVSSFSAAEISRFSIPSLITRSTNDVTQIQMIIAMGMQMIIRAPLMAIYAIIRILGTSWQLSMVVLVAVVIVVGSVLIILLIVMPKFRAIQGMIDDVNRDTRENLTGIRVVRAFNAEGYQEEKFERDNETLKKTQLFTGRGMAFLFPIMTFVQSAVTLAIYYVGSVLINGTADMAGRATMMGDVVAFSSYAMYVIMAFLLLLMIFMLLPRASVAANRINQVLDTEPTLLEGTDTTADEEGTVEFKDVTFRYPDASMDCLKNISFTAKKGETVAFIGATGSGKTTLVNLVARLYDTTSGEVLVDGKDVKDYTFDTLYTKIGFVTQKAILFADTVKGNLTFGNAGHEITDEDVDQALDIAQSATFVSHMEDGVDSYISQSGTNVSGGQKQRLSIARAIARKPEILIFDDSFSALDYKTDSVLRKRINTDLKGTTCLIVAQRVGTIRHADRIVVLDNGEVVGEGTHDELMETCETYKQIALSQLSESELANA